MDAITDGHSRIIGFGGGIRGTKTWGSLAAIIALCRIFPGSRWAVVRKDLQRIKDTVLPSFDKLRVLAGGFVGPVRDTLDLAFAARCTNGSAILFRGENLDTDPQLMRFHGYEVNGFLNEEADELSERTYIKEIERAGTWIVPNGGEQPPAYILNTFNPCPGWPRRRFYNPWRAGTIAAPYAFIPSTAADNPFISDEQRKAWEEMPDAEYKRFVMGDWESLTGAYYDTLDAAVHLIPRSALPPVIPDYWRYWASFDWGYRHWSVMCAWVTDMDGTDYLLDSLWMRGVQDDELAQAFVDEFPPACRRVVYSGHDCWAKPTHHGASGESTTEVFARHKVSLVRADIDPVNGGRATNRAFKIREGRSDTYIIATPSNVKVFDQLAEILPDENDIRKPGKVDADANGVGGDDGADAVRHGMSSRVRPAKLPERFDATGQEPHHDPAIKLTTKDGKPPKWIGPGDPDDASEWTGGYADQLPSGI